MRRFRFVIIGLVVVVVIGLPAAYYYLSRPTPGDQLDNTLRAMGFFPINPPNNLINLGSLYYVDSSEKFFRTICPADTGEIQKSILRSPSTRTVANELYSGTFEVSGNLARADVAAGSGSFNDKRLSRVKYSLSDVQLYEIDLKTNYKIMRELMATDDCQNAVAAVFRAGGYVCQGQTLLEANAVFDLDVKDTTGANTQAKLSKSAVLKAVKDAISAKSNVDLVEHSGKLVTGSALKYGVAMNPTCLTPPHAVFTRVLPTNAFGRIWNFVKFNYIEPLLPKTEN